MRTLRLIYQNLGEKQVGHKLAIIDSDQLNHLRVLKATAEGYEYEIIDGKGRLAEAELLKLTKEGALFTLKTMSQPESKQEYAIALPLIRSTLLEEAVRQVCQFDLYTTIYLYFSDFTRYKDKEFSPNKLKRLEKIALGSVIQSHSLQSPKFVLVENLAAVLSENTHAQIVSPDLSGAILDMKLLGKLTISPTLLVIGAEGGFSESETAQLRASNAYMPKLAGSIFTTETASVVFSSLLSAASSDL